jgi:hypothetical protein
MFFSEVYSLDIHEMGGVLLKKITPKPLVDLLVDEVPWLYPCKFTQKNQKTSGIG